MLQLILRHPAVAPAMGEALTPWTVKIVKIDFQDVYRISGNSFRLDTFWTKIKQTSHCVKVGNYLRKYGKRLESQFLLF